MTATWYLVRHVHDLRRREARNVGVVVRSTAGEWYAKFLGESAPGTIEPRRLVQFPISVDAYQTWVDYFRRKLSDSGWDDVERRQARRSSNYVAEPGGVAEQETTGEALVDELFDELVATESLRSAEVSRTTVARQLTSAVDDILRVARLQVVKRIMVPAVFNGHRTTVPFAYQYLNGQPHLMDIAHRRARVDEAAADARELSARVSAVREAGEVHSFLSFYSAALLPEGAVDEILYPLDRLTVTVNVDQRDQAVDDLRHATS